MTEQYFTPKMFEAEILYKIELEFCIPTCGAYYYVHKDGRNPGWFHETGCPAAQAILNWRKS